MHYIMKALQKLSQQFLLKRKFGEPPEIDGIDREQNRFLLFSDCAIIRSLYRGLLEVFKLILEHTEHIGEQRIQLADSLVSQISEICKTKRKDKEQSFKKVLLLVYATGNLYQDS